MMFCTVIRVACSYPRVQTISWKHVRSIPFSLTWPATRAAGTDVAILDDGPGNDTLLADDAFALLTYQGGASLRVNSFDSVFARGNGGGTNTRTVINPLDYNLVFSGNWV